MALSESEELELLQLQKQKATSGQTKAQPQQPGMFKKGMAYARLPSQFLEAMMSEQGKRMEVEPKGNMVRDIGMNIPSVAMKTLSKTMPGTYTPENLATMGAIEGGGALIPKVAPLARGFSEQLESLVGSPKGTLARGAESVKNFFGPGKKSAQPLYQQAGKVRGGLLDGMYKPEEIVDTARAYLKKGGQLHPSEALKYRKAIDSLAKTGRYVKDEIFAMRSEADAIAKQSPLIAKGDVLYEQGIKNQALRRPFPVTSTGKTATGKTFAMAIPGIGQVMIPLFSPAVQGAVATGLGAGSRAVGGLARNPALIPLIRSLVEQAMQSKQQSTQ